MSTLNEMTLKFKSLFETERARLIFNGKRAAEQLQVSKDDMLDEVDFTAFELENQMQIRLRAREALYLKKIEQALARIKEGSFGLCETCEEQIEPKRLEARPTTTLCVNCKEEQERLERLHIDGHCSKSAGRNIKLA